ncbi:MAG: DUF4279 domain-containing protein [Chloroflexota bacterium]
MLAFRRSYGSQNTMGEVSGSTVSVRITGRSLNPSHITKLLSCEPTRAAKKGDNIANQDGKCRISRTGLWHISYGDIDAVPRRYFLWSISR